MGKPNDPIKVLVPDGASYRFSMKVEAMAEGKPFKLLLPAEPGEAGVIAVAAQADAIFAYTNEEESARLLRELRKQGWKQPVIGETVLTSSKVVELAGEAANGAVAHVGLTVEAPQLQAWGKKFQAA